MSTTVAAAVVPISYRRPIFRRRVGPGRSARGRDGASRLAAAADTEQAGLDDSGCQTPELGGVGLAETQRQGDSRCRVSRRTARLARNAGH